MTSYAFLSTDNPLMNTSYCCCSSFDHFYLGI